MFTQIAVSAIRPSPINPRKTFNQKRIDELAASFKAVGQLEPIMVRPLPPEEANGITHELVFGERRWRAASLADLEFLEAKVKNLTDREVLEIQLFENGERDDVSAPEQGRAYRRLHDEFGLSVEEIASRSGRSTKWVRERMSLGDLCPAAEKALVEERMTLGVALLIGRMPPELQPKALKDMVDGSDELVTVANAKDILERDHMRPLGKAPFSVTDAALVSAAGSCTACPKRTGVQAELFADVKDTNTCTDTKCYQAKVEAHWVQLKARAKETKQTILPDAEAKKVFHHNEYTNHASLQHGSGYVKADDKPWEIADGKKSWKSIVGKDVKPVIAKAPCGEIVELYPASVVNKLKKEALETKRGDDPNPPTGADSAFALEQEANRRKRDAVRLAVVQKAEKRVFGDKQWRILVGALMHMGFDPSIAERRGFDGDDGEDKLEAAVATMKGGELVGLAVELTIDFDMKLAETFAEAYGVDVAALGKKALAEAKAERAAKAKPKPAAAASKPASKAKPKKPAPLPKAKKAKGK